MARSELQIIYTEFPVPPKGEILFTRTISLQDIQYLISASHGQRLYSQDQSVLPGEAPQRVQTILNELAGKPNYQGEFASLAARISRHHKRQRDALGRYGDITLVADPDRIRPETFIFNGDFKTIGHNRIRENGATEGVATWPASCDFPFLAQELDRAMSNPAASADGIIGQYFEARLYRALIPIDLVTVYVPQVDELVAGALEKLKEVRREMLDTR